MDKRYGVSVILKMDIHAILKYILVLVLGLSTTREDWVIQWHLVLLNHLKVWDNLCFMITFFSNVIVAYLLLEHYNTYSSGTARPNWRKLPQSLKKLKKLNRGYKSEVVENNINCIVWQDKKTGIFD